MSEGKNITLLKAAKELNIGIATAADFLVKSGYDIEAKPGTKLSPQIYEVLSREFQGDKIIKEEANQINIGKIRREEAPVDNSPVDKNKPEKETVETTSKKEVSSPAVAAPNSDTKKSDPKPETEINKAPAQEELPQISGMKVVGKIDLDALNKKESKTKESNQTKSSVEPKAQETKVEKDPIENKKTEPVVPAAQEAKKEKEAVKTQTVESTESNKAKTDKPVQDEQNPVASEVKKAEPVKEVKTTTAPKVEVDSKSQKPAVQTPVATSKNVESPKEDSNKFIKTDKSIKTTDNTSKPQTPVAKT